MTGYQEIELFCRIVDIYLHKIKKKRVGEGVKKTLDFLADMSAIKGGGLDPPPAKIKSIFFG